MNLKIYMDNGKNHILFRRMIPYWFQKNVKIVDNPNDANIQLSNVHINNISSLPKILRLDSIYYDTDTDYNSRNRTISDSHSIADGVIYQSKFSSIMVPEYLKKTKAKTTIIYNGIENNWAGKHIHDDKKFHIVVSAIWRRHKRLKEIIQIFLEFSRTHNATLHILGSLEREPNIYPHPQICYYKHIDYDAMANIFRKADVSLHLSKRDSCPNTVVEALGAGIPVITTNSCGGATDMAEMTSGCIVCNGDGDYNDVKPVPHYRDDWNVLPLKAKENILIALEQIYKDKRRVKLPDELTIEYTANEYLNFMEKIIGVK